MTFLVWLSIAWAQDARLDVRLVERGSGVPISACTVQIGQRPSGEAPEGEAGPAGNEGTGELAPPRLITEVTPDDDGRFSVSLDEGLYALAITCEEHQLLSVEETLGAGEQIEITYRLERYTWQEELTVYGEEVREEVSRKVISAEELRQIPGSFGDPVRALQSLPGVARPTALEGDLVVRGAEGINTRFYVDEVPVPYLFHFFVGRSVINASVIDDIEFFAGGMPSRFGDVTQAVVNARTLQDKPKPGIHGRVSVDILDGSASFSGGGDELKWEVGGRYSWLAGTISLGSAIAAATQGVPAYEVPKAFPRYFDYQGRVEWSRGRHRFILSALGARDALILVPPRFDEDGDGEPEPAEVPDVPYDPNRILDSYFHRIHGRWEVAHGGRKSWTWFAVGPDQEANLIQGIGTLANGVEFGRARGTDVILQREDRIPLSETGVLRAGLRTEHRPVGIASYRGLTSADDRIPVTNDVQQKYAGWLEYQKDLGNVWLSPGVRGTLFSFNDQTHFEWEPRLTLRRPIDRTWTATGFLGRFAQIPPADRYARAIGNPELTLMRAWQTSAGLEGRWSSGVELDLSVYATVMQDLVLKDFEVRLQQTPDFFDGEVGNTAFTVLVPIYRDVDGLAYGVEGLLRAKPNNGWFGWLAVALSRTHRFSEDFPQGQTFPGTFDQPIAVTAIGARELPRDWRISSRIRVTSGHPFTPIFGSYDAQNDLWTGVPGETNSERFPWFRSIDVRVDKTWTAKRARWTLYLDVYNVTNTRNFLAATYTPNYARLVPILWIPVIPALGLEVSF